MRAYSTAPRCSSAQALPIPIIVAVPGIKGNRHIDAKQTPMTDLFLTMMDGLGVEQEKLGDSTGRFNLV